MRIRICLTLLIHPRASIKWANTAISVPSSKWANKASSKAVQAINNQAITSLKVISITAIKANIPASLEAVVTALTTCLALINIEAEKLLMVSDLKFLQK